MSLIIGLTGSKRSGKGAIAGFLKNDGAEYFSLSDMVRDEATKVMGEGWTIKDLQDVANNLREKEGAEVFAKRLRRKLRRVNYAVVDGIRNLGEVEELRTNKNFYLVGVDAHRKTRFERLKSVKRSDDPTTFEEFIEIDRRDQGYGEKSTGQQVGRCMKESDFVFFNDGISIDELYTTLQQQFLNMVKGLVVRRPTNDERFMHDAYTASKRSTCLRRHIGAVAVSQDGHPLTSGYNGAPRGHQHCGEMGGCLRDKLGVPSGTSQEICRAVHAEQNVIIQAARKGVSIKDATVYSTVSPCILCSRELINVGIHKVVYDGSYPDERAIEMLETGGIPLKRFTGVKPRAYHILFK